MSRAKCRARWMVSQASSGGTMQSAVENVDELELDVDVEEVLLYD